MTYSPHGGDPIDALAFFLAQHARLHLADMGEERPLAERVFGGLTDEQLRLRPAKGSNSLAWLLWHMARTEDAAVNAVVANRRQVFDEGWAERLKVPRRDIGTGMTEDAVADLTARIDLSVVKAYRSAVGRRTQEGRQPSSSQATFPSPSQGEGPVRVV